MAKGTLITNTERRKIKSLFKTVGSVSEVARMVKRDPASVRRIAQPKKYNPKYFNWESFNNSII